MADIISPRKDQIHHAACKLFRERGFHATSVRDIADAVGIQGASLYSHYHSKDDLLWNIVDEAANRFFESLGPIATSPLGALQRLREAMVSHVRVITDDLDAAAVYTVEWRHLADDRRGSITARRDEYETAFRVLVDDAIRSRYLNTTDAADATRFILTSLNGIYGWFRPDGPMTPEEVGRLLADFILDGLKRRTA